MNSICWRCKGVCYSKNKTPIIIPICLGFIQDSCCALPFNTCVKCVKDFKKWISFLKK